MAPARVHRKGVTPMKALVITFLLFVIVLFVLVAYSLCVMAKDEDDAEQALSLIHIFQSHPLCAECRKQGRYTKATVVDHIVPHRGDQKLFWDRSNWQPLCKACHDRKTWREDNRPTYTY